MAQEPLKVINPYNQKTVCELPFDRGQPLQKKIAGALRAYEIWHRMPLEERIGQIRRGLEIFRRNSEQIALDITLQMGKPLKQAKKEVETFFVRRSFLKKRASIAGLNMFPWGLF
jgi:succinate-semialdehyde dehydrogenase/glutarate-semialdehyde dehydrogenase